MVLTEETSAAIRSSWENPDGTWRVGGYDAGLKKWFLIDEATVTYREATEESVKTKYLNYEIQTIQLKTPYIDNLRAWEITELRVPEEPEYPKTVSRDPYSFEARNAEEEKQLKEFLGIDPPGVDLDTYLSKLDEAGLAEWYEYWVPIFVALGRTDLFRFISDKNIEYTEKLKPPPPELTWWEKLLKFIVDPALSVFLISEAIFKAGYELLTGKELTDAEYELHKLELADWILPINTLSILFTGTNLQGEAEEFGATSHYFDLAASALFFIPLAKIPGFGLKIAEKTGAKGLLEVAGRAGLKKATPERINALIKTGNYEWIFENARINPVGWAQLAPKVSKETQTVISAGLKKQHPNTAYRLWEEAILYSELAKRTFSAKTIDFVRKHKATGIVAVLGSVWGVLGFEAFTNWPLADNIGFLEYKDYDAIEEAFNRGEITKEKALEGMKYVVDLLEGALAKINVSMDWNPLMIAFGRGIQLTAEENLRLAIKARDRIIAAEPPLARGILTITPRPADAKVSVTGQIPTTGEFSAELPIGTYTWNVTKFGYTSKSGTIELTEAGLGFSVEIEKEVVPPEELEEELTISVTPDETNIFISGHPEITREGTYTLPLGPYTIYFSLEGYRDHTKYATLKSGIPVTVSHSMIKEEEPEPEKAELLITSKPSFADVMIDGRSTFQKTPYTAFLDEGMHTIRVELSDYEPEEEEVTLSWGDKKTTEFILNKTPPTKGTLRIISDPPGAQVYIDGESKFATTPYTITLLADSYKIRLTKDGYLSDEADVLVEAGVEIEHKVELSKKPITQGTITITSEPSEADVYIDGKYQFTKTPFTILLDPIEYVVRVQKVGYVPEEKVIEVEEGEVSEVLFILTQEPVEDVITEPYIPYQPYYPPGYETLYPAIYAPPFYEAPAPEPEKELLVNIETTDIKPWKGRIYSIGFQDLSTPDIEPVVLVSDDEEALLLDFLGIFNTINPAKLLGFKLSFDHRYIMHKIMLYRLQSKKWAEIDLKDVKQLLDQVKEEFVYFPDKTGTLDDYGKSLLGKGKYGSQKELLTRFLAKDFEYVKAFEERQLELTNELYQLFRFSASESFSAPEQSAVPGVLAPETTLKPESVPAGGQKQCKNCFAYQPLASEKCEICGVSL